MGATAYKNANSFAQLIEQAQFTKKGKIFSGHVQVKRDRQLYEKYTVIESVQLWAPAYKEPENPKDFETQVFNAACNVLVNNDEITHANL